MCEVDGHHSMAFVATLNENGKETEIGVSRYAANSEEDTHGMAVTIAVEWQKKVLGRQLVGQLIEFARDHGINKLYSLDLVANRAMRELAIDLGMTAQKDPDNRNQVIYTLSL